MPYVISNYIPWAMRSPGQLNLDKLTAGDFILRDVSQPILRPNVFEQQKKKIRKKFVVEIWEIKNENN